jgi:REP element-mobilizing transposase RayT
MPVYRRYFDPGQLQFITSSTYRRVKLFDSERFRRDFVDVLRQLREQWGFLLIGWFVMPEHFHLLLQPQPAESTTRILQELKKQTALRVISARIANILGARRFSRGSACRPPSIAIPTIGSGSGASTHLTSIARRSVWRSSTTCTATPSNEGWSALPSSGRGRALGSITFRIFPSCVWIELIESIGCSNHSLRASQSCALRFSVPY